MDDIEVIVNALGLDEESALFVLELCDMLDREDAIASHGYPKDSPTGRELAARLADTDFRVRLRALAAAEGASAQILASIDDVKRPC